MPTSSQKLKLKPVLKSFNQEHYSNICSRVGSAREELLHLQSQCFTHPHDMDLYLQEKEAMPKFVHLSYGRGEFQESKVKSEMTHIGLWCERNRIIFKGLSLPPGEFYARAESDLRVCISSWRHVLCTDANRLLCSYWQISPIVFSRG
ncbi:hypothetical protein RHSIM_Rhsim03G0008100 [Rhododendron simsii]|uniref:Uncharacterized protein n=1 Tax=Rhododendron simsii TaxID=118357 RepID=A0A834H910_RHOSS|nr:hypothetical protein RHSIM_Rhsim03G0008100 [Rhododendron simsii]